METFSGSKSMSENYKNGVDYYYIKYGKFYRNPHYSIIKNCLCYIYHNFQLNWGNVLDLACCSGEVTSILLEIEPNLMITSCDPYTYEAFHNKTGRIAKKWSFSDIQNGLFSQINISFDVVVLSFAAHLITNLFSTMYPLSMACEYMIIISPHKNPIIQDKMGWQLMHSMLIDRIHTRLYRSYNYNYIDQ